MTYKVGFIGLGIMGQRMLRSMAAHPEFTPTLGFDLSPDTFQAVRAIDAGLKPAASTEALLAAAPDLVYIATPPLTHLDYARKAMDAGIPVFCEKPFAVDLDAAQKLVSDIQASGLPNAINFPFANTAEVDTLENRIRKGRHGEARLLEMRFHFSEWPRTWQRDAAAWLAGRAQGGFLREVFSHFAYLTLRIFGELTIECHHTTFPADPALAESYLTAEGTAGGIPVRISGGVGGTAPDYNEWTVYGTKASFRMTDWHLLHQADADQWEPMAPDNDPSPLAGAQLDDLARLLRGDSHNLPDFAMGYAVQKIVENLLHD